MGEAKRRKLANQNATSLPWDLKEDIASVVRSVEFCTDGGTCAYRALFGGVLMGIIGLPANRKYGSMLFRAGQDPLRDVVAFCGESNLGVFSEQGMMGHIWLEFDDELIDFSSGDWVAQGSHVLALEAQHAAANGYELSGPIQFEIDPPKYIWQPAAPLMNAWKPKGEPDLGDLWYGPVGKYSDPPNSIADGLKEIVKIAYFSQKPRIEALRLAERVNEWKRR